MYAYDRALYAQSTASETNVEPHSLAAGGRDEVKQKNLSVGGKHYPILAGLGSGGFSQVFLIQRTKGAQQAIKRVQGNRKDTEFHQQGIPCLMEASIMASYVHPNLVTSSHIEGHNHTLYIFQEVAICDLDTWRTKVQPTSETVRVLLYSVLSALAYLHSEGIIHADVKDQNILVYGQYDFRLGDGSLACFTAWPRHHLPNTSNYRPPEGWPWLSARLLANTQQSSPTSRGDDARKDASVSWDERVDIFSLGCTMYRVIFDKVLFYCQVKDTNRNKRYKRYINAMIDWMNYYTPGLTAEKDISHYPIEYTEPDIDARLGLQHPDGKLDTNDELVALTLSALHPCVDARPHASDLLRHPMFVDLNRDAPTGHRRASRAHCSQMNCSVMPSPPINETDSRTSDDVGPYISTDDLTAYKVEDEVLSIARRIKAKYLAAVAQDADTHGHMAKMDLLNVTVLWMSKKLLRTKNQHISHRHRWSDIHRLEEDILQRIEFMIH